jgi:hypothetical protein
MVPESKAEVSLSELEKKYATDSESNEPNSVDSQPVIDDGKERERESEIDGEEEDDEEDDEEESEDEEEDDEEDDEEESEDEEVISALEWF